MSRTAELYLSFAGIFHRPHRDVAEHLEDLLELWREEIPEALACTGEIEDFCRRFPRADQRLDVLWEHYIPLFEAGAIQAVPYASVYLSDNGWVWGKEAEEVRDFYRSCGYEVSDEGRELPDHLAVELEFLALLARDGRTAEVAEFREKHLRPFLSKILPLIMESARSVYGSAAGILAIWQLDGKGKGD